MAGAQGPAANLALLDHMLAARHQLGTMLGFQSYAAFKAADGTLAGETYGPRPVQHSPVTLGKQIHRLRDWQLPQT